MASVTTTFSVFGPGPKAVHTGVIVAGGHHSASATISASGVLRMVQVPDQATLVDFWLKVATGGADQTFEIGTSNTPSGIMAITTLTSTYSLSVGTAEEINIINNTLRAPGGTTGGTSDLMPVHVSLSDSVEPQSVWIQGRLTADASASAFFTFCLFYTMDGMPGRTNIR